jgi:xanthine/uracil permease
MTDNNTKTICTTAVWIATAIIFTFGVFRFNWTGAFSGILWAFVAVALTLAATEATRAIWKHPSSEKTSEAPTNEKPKA